MFLSWIVNTSILFSMHNILLEHLPVGVLSDVEYAPFCGSLSYILSAISATCSKSISSGREASFLVICVCVQFIVLQMLKGRVTNGVYS